MIVVPAFQFDAFAACVEHIGSIRRDKITGFPFYTDIKRAIARIFSRTVGAFNRKKSIALDRHIKRMLRLQQIALAKYQIRICKAHAMPLHMDTVRVGHAADSIFIGRILCASVAARIHKRICIGPHLRV